MNSLHFEHFEAKLSAAPVIAVREGYITIDGASFFNRSLKSRRWVRAFTDHTNPVSRAICVISMAGNYLCQADETDPMGLRLLKPGGLEFLTDLFLSEWRDAPEYD
jgi:hypothetical protein